MNNYQLGNPLDVRWACIHSDGTPFPISEFELQLVILTGRGVHVATDTITMQATGNLVTFRFEGRAQHAAGRYSLILRASKNGRLIASFTQNDAFELSNHGSMYGAVSLTTICDAVTVSEATEMARDAAIEAYKIKDVQYLVENEEERKQNERERVAAELERERNYATLAHDTADAAIYANNAANNANAKAIEAREAAQAASDAAYRAIEAIADAGSAASRANEAAGNADAKAQAAEQAAANVGTAISNANTAATRANEAADNADRAAMDARIDLSDVRTRVTTLEQTVPNKQDVISDLATIRSGASMGATAIQKVKTINRQSIIGDGNIEIQGGSGFEPTQSQLNAMNSGIDTTKVAKIATLESTKANDNAVVHTSGSETVGGTKTFSSAPVVPTPTADGHAVNKAYVDAHGGGGFTPTAAQTAAMNSGITAEKVAKYDGYGDKIGDIDAALAAILGEEA